MNDWRWVTVIVCQSICIVLLALSNIAVRETLDHAMNSLDNAAGMIQKQRAALDRAMNALDKQSATLHGVMQMCGGSP